MIWDGELFLQSFETLKIGSQLVIGIGHTFIEVGWENTNLAAEMMSKTMKGTLSESKLRRLI